MSYIVLRVYSFECDMDGCEETTEVGPEAGTLPMAERILRHRDRWRASGGQHVCPQHGEAKP